MRQMSSAPELVSWSTAFYSKYKSGHDLKEDPVSSIVYLGAVAKLSEAKRN
jgi:hypothetical protein